jgi:hypothetical protein
MRKNRYKIRVKKKGKSNKKREKIIKRSQKTKKGKEKT